MREKLSSAVAPLTPPPNAFHLGIGLTRNCTLGCLYCHAEADKKVNAQWPVLAAAIEHAVAAGARTPGRTLSVSFAVGGEPTMNWPLFKRTVLVLRERAARSESGVKRLFLSMTTNGYYGYKKQRFISEHFDHLTVSLDGPPEVHDLHRPNRAGDGSYIVVAQSAKYFLRSSNVRAGLRSTVSSGSVELMPEIVQHFATEFGGGYVVSFEPLIETGRAQRFDEMRSPEMTVFEEKFLEARKIGATCGIRVITSAASTNRLIRHYCGAMSIPSFTVCADGKLTACHRDQDAADYGYGYIDTMSGRVVIDSKRAAGVATKSEMPQSCGTCLAKWHCAGDCPDLRRVGWSRCEFNRSMILSEILTMLQVKTRGPEYGSPTNRKDS